MEALLHNLTKAIGWSIFHSLWQGAIIYSILILLVAAFPRITAKLKYNLAYSSLCTIFACFSITFFHLFKLPLNWDQSANSTHDIQPQQYLSDMMNSTGSQTEKVLPYIVFFYILGLLAQVMMLSAGYRKIHLLKRSEKIAVPGHWQQAFDLLLVKLKLYRQVGFHLSDQVNIPLVIGYFKPMVLFPVALATQLDLKQVEAILIHELAHIRRNDYLFNLIKTVIETLMFFNPFVWLSGRLINIEREHACDDQVIKLTNTPLTYAHALLKLEILKDKSAPTFSMAAAGKQQHLYQRIKRITDMKTNYLNAKQQILTVTLIIVTIISLAWINPKKPEPPIVKQNKLHIEITPLPPEPKSAISISLPAPTPAAPALKQDTTWKKHKFKILTIDANGQRQEYNTVKEMPDSLRKEVIKNTFANTDNFMLDFKLDFNIDSVVNKSLAFTTSPEWQSGIKQMSEKMHKQFSAEEWKKNEEDFKENVEKTLKLLSSKKWEKERKTLSEQVKEIEIQFNSPEFKKEVNKVKFSAEKTRGYGNSLYLKKRTEATNSLESSKEYKELKKKFDEDVQTLKKKTLKTDSTSF